MFATKQRQQSDVVNRRQQILKTKYCKLATGVTSKQYKGESTTPRERVSKDNKTQSNDTKHTGYDK